jgi:hypothetical protein
MYVWLRYVSGADHFTWKAKYLFVHISASVQEIFGKRHMSHFTVMHNKLCMDGINQSVRALK